MQRGTRILTSFAWRGSDKAYIQGKLNRTCQIITDIIRSCVPHLVDPRPTYMCQIVKKPGLGQSY